MDRVTSASDAGSIANEQTARRTGMAFQRTRMSADRTLMSVIRTSLSLISFGFTIAQLFRKLKEAQFFRPGEVAPRNFGIALVLLGIAMLIMGIIYHLSFMLELRTQRRQMVTDGLIRGESRFPASLTLITAVILLLLGIATAISMISRAGPFG